MSLEMLADDVSLTRIGREGEPVVVIDNFIADPQALISAAAGLRYQPLGPHYPGIRAPAAAAYLEARGDLLKQILTDVFGFTRGAALVECNFSLVTTPPAALTPIQRLPHFDSLDRGRLALLHYLGQSAQGGTAFFRHRRTGYETLNAARFEPFRTALDEDVRVAGLPSADYPTRSQELFEEIHRIDAAPNRMAIYRGVTLHCGVIPADFAFDPDPRTGRLTVNTFLQARLTAHDLPGQPP
jgi:Family of unknown function (DUF6445)